MRKGWPHSLKGALTKSQGKDSVGRKRAVGVRSRDALLLPGPEAASGAARGAPRGGQPPPGIRARPPGPDLAETPRTPPTRQGWRPQEGRGARERLGGGDEALGAGKGATALPSGRVPGRRKGTVRAGEEGPDPGGGRVGARISEGRGPRPVGANQP